MMTRKKLLAAALMTVLLLGGIFAVDYFAFSNKNLREISPAQKISIYLDMELLINGKKGLSPQMTHILGQKPSCFLATMPNTSFTVCARSYQVEGMSSQEVLIDFEVSKGRGEEKEILISKTVRAHNRVKSTMLVEQDIGFQDSVQLLVTPYFGPIGGDVAVK